MVGYLVALLVNAQFQYSDDAQANYNLLMDRYYQISEHPEQIIPLLWTKIEKRNTYGWFGILVASSVLFHIKFTASENIALNNLNTFLSVMLLLFGGASPAFFTVIGLQILNINLARTTSKDYHSNGYAQILQENEMCKRLLPF